MCACKTSTHTTFPCISVANTKNLPLTVVSLVHTDTSLPLMTLLTARVRENTNEAAPTVAIATVLIVAWAHSQTKFLKMAPVGDSDIVPPSDVTSQSSCSSGVSCSCLQARVSMVEAFSSIWACTTTEEGWPSECTQSSCWPLE